MFGKKREPTFYERQYAKVQKKIESLEPCTPEYDQAMNELTKLQAFVGKEKEMHQIFDKTGRANVVGKIIGFLGLGGLAWGLCKFEKDGNIFSGSSDNLIGGVIKIGTRLFG